MRFISVLISTLLFSPLVKAADFPGGTHVQGVQDSGQPASAQFPVLIAGTDANGNLVPLKLNADGTLQISNAVITNPTVAGRNTIQPQGDAVEALTLKLHSGTQIANQLQWETETGAIQGVIQPQGTIVLTPVNDSIGLVIDSSAGQSNDLLHVVDNVSGFTLFGVSAPGQGGVFSRSVNSTDSAFSCAESATQTAASFGVFKSDFRTPLFLVGPGLKTGFYGAPAVVQQANASQATINAVADANAKAALQSLYNALKTEGLCAATP